MLLFCVSVKSAGRGRLLCLFLDVVSPPLCIVLHNSYSLWVLFFFPLSIVSCFSLFGVRLVYILACISLWFAFTDSVVF